MNRTARSLRMLEELNRRAGEYVKVKDLAVLLDTNPRNIPEYKKELEAAGYRIETLPGQNGGYCLSEPVVVPAALWSEEEREVLSSLVTALSVRQELTEGERAIAAAALTRALGMTAGDFPLDPSDVFSRYPYAVDKKVLRDRYEVVRYCLFSRHKLTFIYHSLAGKRKPHTMHPYRLFLYNGAWFVLGYDEGDGAIRYYKLHRMLSCAATDESFTVSSDYKEEDWIDRFGLRQPDEPYIPLTLRLTGNAAQLARERIYGKNQTIQEEKDGSITLSCEMQSRSAILSLLLSFGTDCTVLSPKDLRVDLHRLAQRIADHTK